MSHMDRIMRAGGAEHDGCRWLHPMLEATPDLSRGEQRLAAEIAIARLNGDKVPFDVALRARSILEIMANG
jgi:hypothetical protein